MPPSRPPPCVVIVGAGPAGSAAALALARKGRRSILLEKGSPGKPKACGDAWLPRAVEELKAVDLDPLSEDSQARAFADLEGRSAGRIVWRQPLSPSAGVMARRAAIDQGLRDRAAAAGCEVRYGAEARGLRAVGRRVEVTVGRGAAASAIEASAVILATGSFCRLARQAGIDGAPEFGAAASAYATVSGGYPSPTFLFGDPSPGYAWVFPMGKEGANVGLFALSRAAASGLRSGVGRVLGEMGSKATADLRGGVLALWSGAASARVQAGSIVSCGDAAGLVDPLSGEGLTAALVSGRRAGEAVAAFLKGKSGALTAYERWLQDWGRARYAPSTQNRIFAAWAGRAPAERRLFEMLAGLQS